jgi:3-mercaptopyruvate sulfurtransferase SseA
MNRQENYMSTLVRSCFFLTVAAGLLLAQPVMAAEDIEGHLVSAKWLEKNLKNPDVLVLDASSAQSYAAKHIPGATSVDLLSWYGLREIPTAEMENLFRTWGVSSGKKIVMYDQGGTFLATRLFYSLAYYGFPARGLFILDGGLFKWQEAGLPVTKDVPPARKTGSFMIKKINEDIRVYLPEFLTASGDPDNNVLLEALGAEWHFGQVAPFGRAGHVPHGVLLPSADFFNSDKTFKSPDEIRRMLAYLGIRPEQRIYSFCGGGMAASVPFFALKYVVNYPKVKLYQESELGWMADERELPYWTYDAPFLMREAKWLQFWGGQIIRTYGGARVSIVDVRPADAYDQGHVPFALNIPADVFKSHIDDPDNLAGILGPAGVSASGEAVVISGAGLTKEAALAFVMLEKLGHQRVSVFMDSMDDWVKLGFALKKDATIVGPKKTPQDLSIPPAAYPGDFRKDVIFADPKSSPGVYPRSLSPRAGKCRLGLSTAKSFMSRAWIS